MTRGGLSVKNMPDFKKISRLIQSQSQRQERFVLVEEGVPAWVVLSMQDYEELIRAQEQRKQSMQTKAPKALDAALMSYQSEREKDDELSPFPEEQEAASPQDPEIYLEEVSGGPAQMWDLSTAEDGEEEDEFDTIPF